MKIALYFSNSFASSNYWVFLLRSWEAKSRNPFCSLQVDLTRNSRPRSAGTVFSKACVYNISMQAVALPEFVTIGMDLKSVSSKIKKCHRDSVKNCYLRKIFFQKPKVCVILHLIFTAILSKTFSKSWEKVFLKKCPYLICFILTGVDKTRGREIK